MRLTAEARRSEDDGWSGQLYRNKRPAQHAATLTAIPYHLWANREAGGMQVWLREL